MTTTEYRLWGVRVDRGEITLRIAVGKSDRLAEIPLTIKQLARLNEECATTLLRAIEAKP